MISLMNGAVVSIVHVRLGGVVDGFVQMWPGSPLSAQESVSVAQAVMILEVDPLMSMVVAGLMMVTDVAVDQM